LHGVECCKKIIRNFEAGLERNSSLARAAGILLARIAKGLQVPSYSYLTTSSDEILVTSGHWALQKLLKFNSVHSNRLLHLVGIIAYFLIVLKAKARFLHSACHLTNTTNESWLYIVITLVSA
jgi:hypothetical protein